MGSFTELPEGTYCHGYVSGNLKKSLFEDTKGVLRNGTSKKDRQCNGQNKKNKGTNIDLQTFYRKLKIE
jgi:hypothetical protein